MSAKGFGRVNTALKGDFGPESCDLGAVAADGRHPMTDVIGVSRSNLQSRGASEEFSPRSAEAGYRRRMTDWLPTSLPMTSIKRVFLGGDLRDI